MKYNNFTLALILAFHLVISSCGRDSGSSGSDADSITLVSSFKSGFSGTGPCNNCLVMEVRELFLFAILTPTNPAVESCRAEAQYYSNSGVELDFPTNSNETTQWQLFRQSGQNTSAACFPSNLTINISYISEDTFVFSFFDNNSSEYTMILQ